MRRRMGAPSNHYEATGVSMNRNLLTPEEVLASVEHANSPRRYVGMDSTQFTSPSAAPERGTLIPKKNLQAGDPTGYGKGNVARPPMQVTAANPERLGPRYSVGVKFPAISSIEASATMGNARMIPSIAGRQNPNFGMGVEGPY
jgi:hypothetical protein